MPKSNLQRLAASSSAECYLDKLPMCYRALGDFLFDLIYCWLQAAFCSMEDWYGFVVKGSLESSLRSKMRDCQDPVRGHGRRKVFYMGLLFTGID